MQMRKAQSSSSSNTLTLFQLNSTLCDGLVLVEKVDRKGFNSFKAISPCDAKELLSVRIKVAHNGHLA